MGRILLEGGIIFLLVLIGISIFIPSSNSGIDKVIVEFEQTVESGNVVEDGELDNVEISKENRSNFISKMNCKISNTIVDGLNSVFELGIRFLRNALG